MIKYIVMTADIKIPCFSCSSYSIETSWERSDIKLFMNYEDNMSLYFYQHFYYVFLCYLTSYVTLMLLMFQNMLVVCNAH